MTYHQTTIVGRAGGDPTENTLPSGDTVVNVSFAVTETWKDKKDNQKREKTTWYRAAFFGKIGDVAKQYIHKGDQVMVVGTVEATAYLDKEGKPAASLNLRVDQLRLLANGKSGNSGSDHSEYGADDGGKGVTGTDDIPF